MTGIKMNYSKISVIINCHNGERYINDCITSVINQSYKNWELIFWDNASNDNSKLLISEFCDKRIKYFYNPIKTSLSEARNNAIRNSEGEYLAFLDVDDIWHPRKLELQINQINSFDSKPALSYTGFDILLTSNSKNAINQKKYYSKFKYLTHSKKNIYKKLLFENFIVFSTLLVKKDSLVEINGFSSNLDQNEDYEILLKISHDSEAVCLGQKLVKYRIHDSNNSYNNLLKNFKENIFIFNELEDSPELTNAKVRNKLRKILTEIIHMKKYYLILKLFSPKYFFNFVIILSKKYLK